MFPGGRLRMYRSDDGGGGWAACEAGLPQPSYGGVLRNSMTVDGMPASGVYFGTTSGEVYASLDAW